MMIYDMVNELTRDEGVVKHAYQDSLGYWTIGVGHLIDKRKGGGLSDIIIQMILQQDIKEKMGELDVKLPWWRLLNEECQRVLVNMAFNLGVSGLMGFKKFLAALQEGDHELAATEMLDSLWAKQVGARADRLALMVRGGA